MRRVPTRIPADPAVRHTLLVLPSLVLTLVALAPAVPSLAQETPSKAPAAAPSLKGELLRDFDQTTDKILQLAEAIPADKYGWKPSDEVRTVAEVVAHVTTTHYFLGQGLGGELPKEVADKGLRAFAQEIQKTTAKDQVVASFKASVEFAHKAIEGASREQLDKEGEVFGQPSLQWRWILLMVGHGHEHLGQLIAYARSVGVVPPWSR